MHTNHFPWKLLLNNFPSATLNLVAYLFSFSFFNQSVGSTPSKRYLKYGTYQYSSWISCRTSAWSGGITKQVLQSLCSSLASLAISSQKTPSLYSFLYMLTLRFTTQISWCNLCNYVSPSCLETHFINNPSASFKNKSPLILRKSFILGDKFDPTSLPWVIDFKKGSRQSFGRHNLPLIRLGYFFTWSFIFSFFITDLVAKVANESADLFSF